MAAASNERILIDCLWIPPTTQQAESGHLNARIGLVFEILRPHTPKNVIFQVHVPPSKLHAQSAVPLPFHVYKLPLPPTTPKLMTSTSPMLITALKFQVRFGIFSFNALPKEQEMLSKSQETTIVADYTHPSSITRPGCYTLQLTTDPHFKKFSAALCIRVDTESPTHRSLSLLPTDGRLSTTPPSSPSDTKTGSAHASARSAAFSSSRADNTNEDLAKEAAHHDHATVSSLFTQSLPTALYTSPPRSPSRATTQLKSPADSQNNHHSTQATSTSPTRKSLSPASSPKASGTASSSSFVFPEQLSTRLPGQGYSHSLPTTPRTGSPVKSPTPSDTPAGRKAAAEQVAREKIQQRRNDLALRASTSPSSSPVSSFSPVMLQEMQQVARGLMQVARLCQQILSPPMQTKIMEIESLTQQSENKRYVIKILYRKPENIETIINTAIAKEFKSIHPHAIIQFVAQYPLFTSWNPLSKDKQETERTAKAALTTFLNPESIVRIASTILTTVFSDQKAETISLLEAEANNFMDTIFNFYDFSVETPNFTEV